MTTSFETILIDGYPFLKGYGQLNPTCLFGLVPEDRLARIGRPIETSANRCDEVAPYVTYKGTIILDNQLYLAFLIPAREIIGWDLFNPQKPIYKLYAVLAGEELLCSNFNDLTIRIYKPEFKFYHEHPAQNFVH